MARMAVGSSMLATIRTAPPQWPQVLTSMLKTRLRRCRHLAPCVLAGGDAVGDRTQPQRVQAVVAASAVGQRMLHRENGQTLTALAEHMDMSRQAVTQHLQLLEEANLVAVVWQGREKLHYLNPVPLHDIYARWIEEFERGRLGALRKLRKKLEGDDDEKA